MGVSGLVLPRLAAALLVASFVLALALAESAQMSTFGRGASPAGAGSSDISGFTVTDVSYQPDRANAELLGIVSFQLDSPATSVSAIVDQQQLACDAVGRMVICDAGAHELPMSSLTKLSVSASA